MQKICPTIDSYSEATAFLSKCKNIRFHYIEAEKNYQFGSFVLSTGYKPNKFTLSLIKSYDSEEKLDLILRLVLNERGCKSIYNIKDYRAFKKILDEVVRIVKTKNQKLYIIYSDENHKKRLISMIDDYHINIKYDLNKAKQS